MKDISFESGKREYTVNGGAVIHFNPADIDFVNRLFALTDKLEKRNDEPNLDSGEGVFELAERRNRETREDIDRVFEEPVCDKIFGTANVWSPAGGIPLFMNFLLAVIDEIDEAAKTEMKPSPKIEAYMKKYEKYQKK